MQYAQSKSALCAYQGLFQSSLQDAPKRTVKEPYSTSTAVVSQRYSLLSFCLLEFYPADVARMIYHVCNSDAGCSRETKACERLSKPVSSILLHCVC